MYAIVEDGGKQYRVQLGDTLYLETRDLPEDTQTLELNQVLLVGGEGQPKVGTPWVDGASVTARILEATKGPKVHIVKFKRRKNYRRKTGHRQKYLKVAVEKINA